MRNKAVHLSALVRDACIELHAIDLYTGAERGHACGHCAGEGVGQWTWSEKVACTLKKQSQRKENQAVVQPVKSTGLLHPLSALHGWPGCLLENCSLRHGACSIVFGTFTTAFLEHSLPEISPLHLFCVARNISAFSVAGHRITPREGAFA